MHLPNCPSKCELQWRPSAADARSARRMPHTSVPAIYQNGLSVCGEVNSYPGKSAQRYATRRLRLRCEIGLFRIIRFVEA